MQRPAIASPDHVRTAALVAAAASGDGTAWERIIDSYGGLIWAIARNHRLAPGDAADVSQTTWLRLVENIHRLSEPSRVGAWLATTARRECLRVSAGRRRTVLVAEELDPGIDRLRDAVPEPDAALLDAERARTVRRAVAQLSARDQELLQFLMRDPAPSYEEIAAAMDMPVGSIGPTRGRCLGKLRTLVTADGIAAAGARAS